MGSNRGVATFFDVETFSTIQDGFLTPYDLPHYDPNQIFNSLRDGGISKRNFLENSRGTRERDLCATLAQRGERGSLGCATLLGIESLGLQGMGCSHIYSFLSLHLLIAIGDFLSY